MTAPLDLDALEKLILLDRTNAWYEYNSETVLQAVPQLIALVRRLEQRARLAEGLMLEKLELSSERLRELEKQDATLAEAERALEWYASSEPYRYALIEPGNTATYMGAPAVISDDGKRAQNALQRIRAAKGATG